jgi:hypothetical protein
VLHWDLDHRLPGTASYVLAINGCAVVGEIAEGRGAAFEENELACQFIEGQQVGLELEWERLVCGKVFGFICFV